MIGLKFGRLTVKSKGMRSGEQCFKWLCVCECGKEKCVRADHLKSGRTVSCGCARVEARKEFEKRKTDYGIRKHALYGVWMSMRQRCRDKNHTSYKYYGLKGIRVCDDWNRSYNSFFNWSMLNGYQSGLEIDRKENDGDYSPSNCRWVTPKQNCNNKSNNIYVNLDGELMTVQQACEKLRLKASIIRQRMKRGHSFESAISKYLK